MQSSLVKHADHNQILCGYMMMMWYIIVLNYSFDFILHHRNEQIKGAKQHWT